MQYATPEVLTECPCVKPVDAKYVHAKHPRVNTYVPPVVKGPTGYSIYINCSGRTYVNKYDPNAHLLYYAKSKSQTYNAMLDQVKGKTVEVIAMVRPMRYVHARAYVSGSTAEYYIMQLLPFI